MSARVVVVHDDSLFIDQAINVLGGSGYNVAAFTDSLDAWITLGAAPRIELLLTRVPFQKGKPNGVSLALMARDKQPGIKIIFADLPEFAKHTEGIGEFMPLPLDMTTLVQAVERLLGSSRETSPVGRRHGSELRHMRKQSPWAIAGTEPSIAELLSDPITHALMRADGISMNDVVALIRSLNSDHRIQGGAHAMLFPS